MDSSNKKYKILLTGGGTGGSVTPLLAVYDELKGASGFEFMWLGTKFGPERLMVEKAGIKFKAISGGKWRRYFSLKNLADIFKIKLGFWQAFFIMLKWRPNLIMSAGSFVSVPVVWAAWLLGVPVMVHQQDVMPGLANKLMALLARVVTVTFEKSLNDYGKKAVWTGNPTRRSLELPNPKSQFPNINTSLPVVLILGGGTGAEAINRLVGQSLGELVKFCQVAHITGKEKSIKYQVSSIKNYTQHEFLDSEKMAGAMRAADLVVTRAGMGVLSELSFLGKPAIIIPLPDSHQEANAQYYRNIRAAITVKQKYLTPENFTQMIKDLLADEKMLNQLSANMKIAMKAGASEAMAEVILKLII